jgi:hypothetical protein
MAVGSRFEVVARFRGRRQRFEYVVTKLEEGSRIALRGEGEKVVSDDVITVAAAGNGTRVAAEPFLGSTFERTGDAALDGLAARLARAPE